MFWTVWSSNGNDIKTKRNDASIIGVFFSTEAKRTHLFQTWKKRSEANTIIKILCRIEEITNIISLRPFSIEAKRTDLLKIYARSNKSIQG